VIPIARPYLGPEEEAAVIEVMRSGVLAQGPRVRAFEQAFATAHGARQGVATSSGSTALQLALLAHGIGPGDEVIVTPLSFIATANAIIHAGARPVFADVDETLNLDPHAAEAAITNRTRAIVPVHLHGCPANLDALSEIAREWGVALIQDACQAVGAEFRGRPLGAFGTAVYSFYATKNITTGEGGMVTTDDENVAVAIAGLRHQAYTAEPYTHSKVGFNYRMTEIQAAIGLVQLARLETLTARRRANAAYYDSEIRGFEKPARTSGAKHVFHHYCLLAGPGRDRDELVTRLRQRGVASDVHYPVPIYNQPAYRKYAAPACPVAESAAQNIFSIPVHSALTDAEREQVAAAVNAL
jgi:perosamine synthetase